MIIAGCTIVSSLMSAKLVEKLGTGKLTALSVGITCLALFGFSFSHSFLMIVLWAVPYGLGAGAVDAGLNNYVALHYESRHMSWLHCMWGIGASLGPYIMSYAISRTQGWQMGYRYIALIQLALTALLIFSLPLWKEKDGEEGSGASQPAGSPAHAMTFSDILHTPGAKEVMITFFCYCALEQTAGLWASSFLVLHFHVGTDMAAGFAGLFYIGITIGRAVNGFLTFRLSDTSLIRLGEGIILTGVLLLALPVSSSAASIGLIVIGLGCAPVYPSLIHATPYHFGAEKSQALMGVQMASAYVGSCLMPPLFGLLAQQIGTGLLPYYLLALLVVMGFTHEMLNRKAPHHT
jgi:fucose permease